MLVCVGGFGVFTIVFGISRNLILSLVALTLVGASDMVSVVIRVTLLQLMTPDQMRGRVNAVDMVFIGASNELGQFESGTNGQLVWNRSCGYFRWNRSFGRYGALGFWFSGTPPSRQANFRRRTKSLQNCAVDSAKNGPIAVFAEATSEY